MCEALGLIPNTGGEGRAGVVKRLQTEEQSGQRNVLQFYSDNHLDFIVLFVCSLVWWLHPIVLRLTSGSVVRDPSW